MSYLNDVQDSKVSFALAALRSYQRLQRETEFWETLVEQRVANLSEAGREEFSKIKARRGPDAAGDLFPRALADR